MATKDKELPAEETKTVEPTKIQIASMQVLVAIKKDDELKTVELSSVGYQNMLEDIEKCKESPERLTSNWKGYRLATEEEVAAFLESNGVKTEFANKYL